jgi:hypothetical protein
LKSTAGVLNTPWNTPCKDCKDRHVNCHSKCDKYNDWKAEIAAIKERVTNVKIREAEQIRRRNEAIQRCKSH